MDAALSDMHELNTEPNSFSPRARSASPRRELEIEVSLPLLDGQSITRLVDSAPLDDRALTEALYDVTPRARSERVSRVLNVVIAVVGLVLLAPICLLVAIAVKLSSPGPVFYVQPRVGLDRRWKRARQLGERRQRDLGGVVFSIYKFRSMRVVAESAGVAVGAQKGDSRVTAVGRVIRALRLDELPQLVNVIKGDMNIVGPRPERPSIFVRLRGDIPHYHVRQRVKPGITGLAQINQAYDVSIDDVRNKVRYDLEYLRRQSAWEDVKIMAKTIPVMILKKGGW